MIEAEGQQQAHPAQPQLQSQHMRQPPEPSRDDLHRRGLRIDRAAFAVFVICAVAFVASQIHVLSQANTAAHHRVVTAATSDAGPSRWGWLSGARSPVPFPPYAELLVIHTEYGANEAAARACEYDYGCRQKKRAGVAGPISGTAVDVDDGGEIGSGIVRAGRAGDGLARGDNDENRVGKVQRQQGDGAEDRDRIGYAPALDDDGVYREVQREQGVVGKAIKKTAEKVKEEVGRAVESLEESVDRTIGKAEEKICDQVCKEKAGDGLNPKDTNEDSQGAQRSAQEAGRLGGYLTEDEIRQRFHTWAKEMKPR
ncbi:hypothetical protein Pelo_9853 [Pelomyxa schiedti]|nr:hypothetical protein Pelo_9853 [Pelomyxa schiedti]